MHNLKHLFYSRKARWCSHIIKTCCDQRIALSATNFYIYFFSVELSAAVFLAVAFFVVVVFFAAVFLVVVFLAAAVFFAGDFLAAVVF